MGVCMKRKNENSVSNEIKQFEGYRLPHFTYSGKEVLSISKFEKKIKEEIRRVKELPVGSRGGWVETSRSEGQVFMEEPVEILKNCASVRSRKLNEAGITKVNQLIFANLSQQEIESKLTSISESTGISISYIKGYHHQAKTATPGHLPPTINDLDAENPYLSR